MEFNVQKSLIQLAATPVTGSAFTQARYKIKPAFFDQLNQLVVAHYHKTQKRRWKGHILLAGDGTTLNLPVSKDIAQHFGTQFTNDHGVTRHLARVFFFYDVLNDFVVANKISPMQIGEKPLMLACSKQLEDKDQLLILDRGFGHFSTIKQLLKDQKKFCIRLPVKVSTFAKNAYLNEKDDFIVRWSASDTEKRGCDTNKVDHHPIQVRITKIKLRSGQTEVLVSNLMDQSLYKRKILDASITYVGE